jgi:hypothetical protein
MYGIFTGGISVKGALTYSLKDIASAMYRHGMICTNWNTPAILNGWDAMVNAIPYIKKRDIGLAQSIIDYNEVDCKTLWEIMLYLRNVVSRLSYQDTETEPTVSRV